MDPKNAFCANAFLQSGCFLASPHLNKVWCSFGEMKRAKVKEQPFSFYQNDFFLENKTPWLSGEHFFEFSFSQFEDILSNFAVEKPHVVWEEKSLENYKKQFASLMTEIHSGHLQKGVPYATEVARFDLNKNHFSYFMHSLFKQKKSPDLYLYGFWDWEKRTGCLGATPELLFIQNQDHVKTNALAGTIATPVPPPSEAVSSRGLTAGSRKIEQEHQFVIDGMKESLSKFGSLKIEKTQFLKLRNFSHLKTDISIQLNHPTFDFESFLKALHPTAALGTLPKNAASPWLNSLEQLGETRDQYANAFAVSLNESFSLCVGTIRCLQWKDDLLKITAGGGVIAQSVFDDEWNEICLKLNTIKESFGFNYE